MSTSLAIYSRGYTCRKKFTSDDKKRILYKPHDEGEHFLNPKNQLWQQQLHSHHHFEGQKELHTVHTFLFLHPEVLS